MLGMREMLRSSLGRSLRALDPADRLAAAWPVACGRSMADHGEIAGYEDGCVRIEVRDEVWLQQMLRMRTPLTADLRRIAGVEVREIHFELCGAGARAGTPGGRTEARPARPTPNRRQHDRA